MIFGNFNFDSTSCINTAGKTSIIKFIPLGSVLNHFSLMNVFFLPGVPNSSSVFNHRANIWFIGKIFQLGIIDLNIPFNEF